MDQEENAKHPGPDQEAKPQRKEREHVPRKDEKGKKKVHPEAHGGEHTTL